MFGTLLIKAVFDMQRDKFVSNTRPLKRNTLSSQCNKNEMTSKQSNRMRCFYFFLFSLCRYGNFNAHFKALQASALQAPQNRSTSILLLGLVYGRRGVSTSVVHLVQVPNGTATVILKRRFCAHTSRRNSHRRLLVRKRNLSK